MPFSFTHSNIAFFRKKMLSIDSCVAFHLNPNNVYLMLFVGYCNDSFFNWLINWVLTTLTLSIDHSYMYSLKNDITAEYSFCSSMKKHYRYVFDTSIPMESRHWSLLVRRFALSKSCNHDIIPSWSNGLI